MNRQAGEPGVAKHSISPHFVASTLNDKISFQKEDKAKKDSRYAARIQTKQYHFDKEANNIQAQTLKEDTKAMSKIYG